LLSGLGDLQAIIDEATFSNINGKTRMEKCRKSPYGLI
jgi:hypothetical protein